MHASPKDIVLDMASGATLAYAWGDRSIAFHTCKTCGCTTHWAPVGEGDRMALNGRLAEPDQLEGVPTRHFDGAETWSFLD